MVEIVGKNRRKVPVLLTEDVNAAIITLNKARNDGEVCQSNEFVFAVNDGKSKNSLRGHDVLKNTCDKVQLQEPDLVKSTNLRKYVATVSQLVDMNESEMGWLANHLGHDIHVHKEFYRLPQTTLEMAVVGNLLMAVDEGRAHLFKGKNPREIKLADFDTTAEEYNMGSEDRNGESSRQMAEMAGTSREESSGSSRQMAEMAGTSKEKPNGLNKRKKKVSKPWTTEEKKIVHKHFSTNIKENELPKKR